MLCYINHQVGAIPLYPNRLASGKQRLTKFRGQKQCFNYVPPDWKLSVGSAEIEYKVHLCRPGWDGSPGIEFDTEGNESSKKPVIPDSSEDPEAPSDNST